MPKSRLLNFFENENCGNEHLFDYFYYTPPFFFFQISKLREKAHFLPIFCVLLDFAFVFAKMVFNNASINMLRILIDFLVDFHFLRPLFAFRRPTQERLSRRGSELLARLIIQPQPLVFSLSSLAPNLGAAQPRRLAQSPYFWTLLSKLQVHPR